MGEQNVSREQSGGQTRAFMRALLSDVHALERMLDEGRIETGIRRIGFEQEMFLVDARYEPAPVATEVLEALDDPDFAHELALFNLEANLQPLELGGTCLSDVDETLRSKVMAAREAARRHDAGAIAKILGGNWMRLLRQVWT